MAFLEINGWAVAVKVRAFQDSRDDVESRDRQFDGSLFLDIRSQHSAFDISTTKILDAATRDALRKVVQGDGEHWSFDADQYGSRGTGISSGTFAIVGGGKFGAYLDVTAGPAIFSTKFGIGAVWTVAYWRDEGVLDWHQIIVTSDGKKWRDGVRNDAEPTPELFVNTPGDVELSTGAYDDLVALPHIILDEQGDTWPQAVAYSELPRLLVTGDGIPDDPQEVLGEWNRSGDIPLADSVASYRGSFLLRTTGGTFRSSPTTDVPPTESNAIQSGVDTATFPESAWVHSGIGTLTFVGGQPVLTIGVGLTGTARATFVNTGVFQFGSFSKLVGRIAQSMVGASILDSCRIIAADPDDADMYVYAASQYDGANWDVRTENSSPAFGVSGLDSNYNSGAGEDVMTLEITVKADVSQRPTAPSFGGSVRRPDTSSFGGILISSLNPQHANYEPDYGSGPIYEYAFELVSNNIAGSEYTARLEFLQIASTDLRTDPARLILQLDELSAKYKDASGNVLATIASDAVAMWEDRSGAQNHARLTSAVTSFLDVATMAQESVDFSTTGLEVLDASGFTIRPSRGFEAMVVLQTSDASTNSGPLGKWGGVNEWLLAHRDANAPNSVVAVLNNSNWVERDAVGTFQVNDGNPHILGFRVTSGVSPLLIVSVDGVDISAGTAVGSLQIDWNFNIAIGRYQVDNVVTQYIGLLGAVLLWDGALSTANRATQIAALKATWTIP